MSDPYVDLVGELQPGQEGWLPLDEAGSPSGPATLSPPPGPNAKACSVKRNSTENVDAGQDSLTTPTGAPLAPPLTSNVDRRYPNDPANPVPPPVSVIQNLTPATAEVGSADITMTVNGTGFSSDCVIVFNGGDEPTTFISDTQVSTGVKPSTASGPAVCPVAVRGPGGTSNSVDFEFTAPAGRTTRRK
jgi:hypothetical protein